MAWSSKQLAEYHSTALTSRENAYFLFGPVLSKHHFPSNGANFLDRELWVGLLNFFFYGQISLQAVDVALAKISNRQIGSHLDRSFLGLQFTYEEPQKSGFSFSVLTDNAQSCPSANFKAKI